MYVDLVVRKLLVIGRGDDGVIGIGVDMDVMLFGKLHDLSDLLHRNTNLGQRFFGGNIIDQGTVVGNDISIGKIKSQSVGCFQNASYGPAAR